MRPNRLVCKNCGSSDIIPYPKVKYAVVQETDPKTHKPIGKPQTVFVFMCQSCGESIYLDKFEVFKNIYSD